MGTRPEKIGENPRVKKERRRNDNVEAGREQDEAEERNDGGGALRENARGRAQGAGWRRRQRTGGAWIGTDSRHSPRGTAGRRQALGTPHAARRPGAVSRSARAPLFRPRFIPFTPTAFSYHPECSPRMHKFPFPSQSRSSALRGSSHLAGRFER